MTEPNEMTPSQARGIIEQYKKDRQSVDRFVVDECKGFLNGDAYRKKKAEKLIALIKEITRKKVCYGICSCHQEMDVLDEAIAEYEKEKS